MNLEKEINRLNNLKQNKNKPKEEISKLARINISKRQVDIAEDFDIPEDKKLAKKLFDEYLDNVDFNDFAKLKSLKILIFEEVLECNLRKQINKLTKEERYPDDRLIKSLHDVGDRIRKLKIRLGIDKEKTEDSDLTKLQQMEKRFNLYIPFNRNEFSTVCAYCGKMLLLRRRVKNFNCLKHPAFVGRFLYNIAIIDDVKSGKITKEMAASYLRTSSDYIDWVIKKENEIISIEDIKQDRVDEFVNNSPFLRNVKR